MGYEKKRMKIKLLDERPNEMPELPDHASVKIVAKGPDEIPNQPKQVYIVTKVVYRSLDNQVLGREMLAVYSRPLDAERAVKEIEKTNEKDLKDLDVDPVVRGFVVSLPLDPDGSY